MSNNINLSVIIVNFNTSSLLKSCLDGLFSSLKLSDITDKTEVIVIDNASSDNSVNAVKQNFPKVSIIINKQNLGFARANNQGIIKSKGKYILLLNSDARVCDRAIEKSMAFLEKNKSIGVIGGKLMYENKTLQKSLGFFPHLTSVFNWMFFIDDIAQLGNFIKAYHIENPGFYRISQKVDWVSGAYFMIKKDVVDKVGLLDESLFMYGEEVDWCYRIKKAGYEVIYDPGIEIIHDKGGSSEAGRDAGIIEELKFIRYFFEKYHPGWQQEAVKIILRLGCRLRSILFGIIPGYRTRQELYEKASHLA